MVVDSLHEIGLFASAAASVFIAVFASAFLFLRRDRRADRIRIVTMQADEFDRLRSEQNLTKQQEKLRQRMRSRIKMMRSVLERFRLQRLAASKNLKRKLAMAGLRQQSAAVTYVFSRLALAAGAVFLMLLFTGLSSKFNPSAPVHILLVVVAAAVGYALPPIAIKNATQKRQNSMTQAFPDMLDMLVICVESGLSIGAAFARVTEEIAETSPILSRELALLTAELMFLGERRVAYQNFAERTGLQPARTLATTLVQSDRYGTPVSTALKVLAQEYRDERMSRAEKKASSLPAKLSVPMILFFMPSLFLVMLGPPLLTIFMK